MKTKKILVRSVLVLVALAALCACAWCVWYIIQYYQGQSFGDRMRANAPDDTGSFQLERVKIPVDFDELQAMNPDIYAWVTIPDTDISYAVLQRDGDDDQEYYSKHSENGAYYSGGSIFSQDYNQKDFSDPMTVLYGHNLRNGRMFAQLTTFRTPRSLRRTATSMSISRTGCLSMRSSRPIRTRTSTCCYATTLRTRTISRRILTACRRKRACRPTSAPTPGPNRATGC